MMTQKFRIRTRLRYMLNKTKHFVFKKQFIPITLTSDDTTNNKELQDYKCTSLSCTNARGRREN